MKKLLLLLLPLIAFTLPSFSQATYYQETGRGFSIGGAYSSKKNYDLVSAGITGRMSRSFSFNFEYTRMSAFGESFSALIPSITIQTPKSNLIGLAGSLGYTKSPLSRDIPLLLIGLEAFLRTNEESIVQVIPHISGSFSVKLKNSYYDPQPVFGVGANLAVRLGEGVFIVGGPTLSISDGDNQLSGNLGLVVL